MAGQLREEIARQQATHATEAWNRAHPQPPIQKKELHELNSPDVSTEELQEQLNLRRQERASAKGNPQSSASDEIRAFAQANSMPEDEAADHMPTDFYLHHKENQGKYKLAVSKRVFDPEPVQHGGDVDLTKTPPTGYLEGATGIPYIKTQFGLIRAYNESNPKANHDESYKSILQTMSRHLQRNETEAARKLYESLPRQDRGITLTDTHISSNAVKHIGGLSRKIANLGLSGTIPMDQAASHLKQAQAAYRELPYHLREVVPDGDTKSPLQHLKDAEYNHASLMRQADARKGWVRGIAGRLGGALKKNIGMGRYGDLPFDMVDNPAYDPVNNPDEPQRIRSNAGRDAHELYEGRYMFKPDDSVKDPNMS
jgi:hypothetical protein